MMYEQRQGSERFNGELKQGAKPVNRRVSYLTIFRNSHRPAPVFIELIKRFPATVYVILGQWHSLFRLRWSSQLV